MNMGENVPLQATEASFKDRLQWEKEVLDEKIVKLETFVGSENFKKIDPVQMTLLNVQLLSMKTYGQCLLERLVRL